MKKVSPRIGDLAIARFDDCEVVCIVTKRDPHKWFEFIYSPKRGVVRTSKLPQGRFQAVTTWSGLPDGRFNLTNMVV